MSHFKHWGNSTTHANRDEMELPCTNCLTRPMCKTRMDEYIQLRKGTFTSGRLAAYQVCANVLQPKCHLIKEFEEWMYEHTTDPSKKYHTLFMSMIINATFYGSTFYG